MTPYYCTICKLSCPSSYQWEQHLAGQKHQRMSATTNSPKCSCGQTSVKRTVRKEGPNQGREFYVCSLDDCNFFEWTDSQDKKIIVAKDLPPVNKKRSRDELENDSMSAEFYGQKYVLMKNIVDNIYVIDVEHKFERIAYMKGALQGFLVFLEFRSNGDLELNFKYNEILMGLVKEYVKGRTFDRFTKSWVVPRCSIQDAAELLHFLGVELFPSHQKELQRALAGQTAADKELLSAITIVHRSKLSLDVSFFYDADIVNVLRQIHPHQRHYEAETKHWLVDIAALPQLLESLATLGYTKVPRNLQNLSAEVDDTSNSSDMESSGNELESHHPDIKSNDSEVRFKSEVFLVKEIIDHVSSIERAIKVRECTVSCDCGQPWKRIGNNPHVCRFFGHFRCDGCGNPWTSAYCWKGESQLCRSCNREQMPWKKERLQSNLGVLGGGEHDSSRCSMCKKVGRCNRT